MLQQNISKQKRNVSNVLIEPTHLIGPNLATLNPAKKNEFSCLNNSWDNNHSFENYRTCIKMRSFYCKLFNNQYIMNDRIIKKII